MGYVNSGSGGVPASGEERERQNREMRKRLQRAAADREAEREGHRLANIGYEAWLPETYAAMNLDDIIEIPCIENGQKVMQRFHEREGRLVPVEQ